MKTNTTAPNYKGFRFPPEIISHAVWLYFRFSLSFRDVARADDAQRGIVVTYETVRQWCLRIWADVRQRTPPPPPSVWGQVARRTCVFLTINGKRHYLWRAVDQHGNVLDILVQSRRNTHAAKRFFRKLLKNLEYVPRVIVTDKLGSYQVAHRELLASVEHRRSKYLNNRIENSHQPTRQQERAMKRFTSPGHAQRFLSAFSGISLHFRPGRHRLTAPALRTQMSDRFTVWREGTATVVACNVN